MNKYISNRVASLPAYMPQEDKCKIILDANECPFDVPPEIKEIVLKQINELPFNRYPDSRATELVENYSKVINVPSDNIVAGNGSDELISLIITGLLDKIDTILTTDPDFSMYNFYASVADINSEIFHKDDGRIDLDGIARVVKEKNIKLVIFSNPCNPTGIAYGKATISAFVENTDAIVVIDEAYADFAEDDISVIDECQTRDNLIVLKTMSKAYGLAGLRVGFAVSNKDIINALVKIKSPYNINSISQKAASVILDNNTVAKQIEYIKSEKKRLYEALTEIFADKYQIVNTDANFINIIFDKANKPAYYYTELVKKSIRVRKYSASLRITVGTHDENDALITAIGEIVKGDE